MSSLFVSSPVSSFNREREELARALADARRSLKETELREEGSLDQVKKSVLLVEQVQFEKTEVRTTKFPHCPNSK